MTLLDYYEAVEQASCEMLDAARGGDWEQVVKLEGACVLLISRLEHAATQLDIVPIDRQVKGRILQRIVSNDAQIRHLANPVPAQLATLLGAPRPAAH